MDPNQNFDHRSFATQSLDELEGMVWDPPSYDSHLVQTCHQLRSKPVGEFSIEELRIMIGQQIGLPFLIPLALDQLETNSWVNGDFYPGDLLAATIRAEFPWSTRADLQQRMRTVIERALREIRDLDQLGKQNFADDEFLSAGTARKLEAELLERQCRI